VEIEGPFMIRSIRVVFVFHHHQPSGNFDHVIDDSATRAYLPMLRLLKKHPSIEVSLHYSGTLLNWLEEMRPEFSDELRDIVRQGKVELLSGAFFEPVLAGIPEQDRIGQILKMNTHLRHHYGYDAKGLWLAEKVWEPDLPRSIEQANMRYTLLNEENFITNGVNENPVRGYFNTESEGHTLGVFPISRKAADLMLQHRPSELLDYLDEQCSDNDQHVLVIADDGERFALAEDAAEKSVHPWLDELFTLIENRSDRIQTTTLRRYWENVPPQGIAYFATGSYNDMQAWSLQNQAQNRFNDLLKELSSHPDFQELRPFIRGGIWRNFMTKYHESNWMQKRIQHVSRKFRLLESQVNNKNKLRAIRDALWLASCNDVFWHGHYGGIYLPHLRSATWKSLIRAEKCIEEKLYNLSDSNMVHNEADFDRDGHAEIQLSTRKYSAIFSKKYSGALVEFDYKPSDYNLFDSIRRYPEAYHQQLIYSENSTSDQLSAQIDSYTGRDGFIFDERPRYGLFERFFDKTITVGGLHSNAYEEASDFINETVDVCNSSRDRSIQFERKGWINWQRARVRKNIHFEEAGFNVDYHIANIGIGDNRFSFGPEFNFSLHSGEDSEKKLLASRPLNGEGYRDFLELEDITLFGFENHREKVKVTLEFSRPTKLFMYPVETIIKTQQGFEKIYQSTCVLPLWDLQLNPGKNAELSLIFRIEDII